MTAHLQKLAIASLLPGLQKSAVLGAGPLLGDGDPTSNNHFYAGDGVPGSARFTNSGSALMNRIKETTPAWLDSLKDENGRFTPEGAHRLQYLADKYLTPDAGYSSDGWAHTVNRIKDTITSNIPEIPSLREWYAPRGINESIGGIDPGRKLYDLIKSQPFLAKAFQYSDHIKGLAPILSRPGQAEMLRNIIKGIHLP